MHLYFTALRPDHWVAEAVGGTLIGSVRFRGFEKSRVSMGPPIGTSSLSVSGRALLM